jgi:DNA-binding CsgD family transcriptional regulator
MVGQATRELGNELTAVELRVVELSSRGTSLAEIGEIMHYSRDYVQQLVDNAYRKTHVQPRNRLALVGLAFRKGWIK